VRWCAVVPLVRGARWSLQAAAEQRVRWVAPGGEVRHGERERVCYLVAHCVCNIFGHEAFHGVSLSIGVGNAECCTNVFAVNISLEDNCAHNHPVAQRDAYSAAYRRSRYRGPSP
jgi:hypothetical protein